MPRIGPFEALVYDARVAGPLDLVTSRPYDVINAGLRDRYQDRSPFNIVRVDLPEHEPASGVDPYDRAARTLADWLAQGVVRRTNEGYIAYELRYPSPEGGHGSVRGIMAALALEPWGGRIWPHEEVMAGPIEDRLRLLRATRTHLSPIYGTVSGPFEPLHAIWTELAGRAPDADVTDVEEVRHRTWHIPADPAIAACLTDADLLIADGHHRYTTALAYRDERRSADGAGPWDEVLAFIVDTATIEVPVRPYHRVQHQGAVLAGGVPTSRAAALASLADDPPVIVSVTRAPEGPVFAVHHMDGAGPAVIALHRTSSGAAVHQDDVTFTHELADAIDVVERGDAAAAYILPPTETRRIMAIVREGARMPRKSTFFWPKPRTGLAMMPIGEPVAPAGSPSEASITDRSAPPAS